MNSKSGETLPKGPTDRHSKTNSKITSPRSPDPSFDVIRPSGEFISRFFAAPQNFSFIPVRKKESVRFDINSKSSINNMVVLMLLIVMRLGSTLSIVNITEPFAKDLQDLGWNLDEINFYVGTVFLSSQCFSFILLSLIGICIILYRILSKPSPINGKSAMKRVYFLFFSIIGVAASYLLQVFGVLYVNVPVLATARVLLSFFNAFNRCMFF